MKQRINRTRRTPLAHGCRGRRAWVRRAMTLCIAFALPQIASAQTFNMRQYFPTGEGDNWHLIGIVSEGGTPEDNFTYTVQAPRGDLVPGRSVVPFLTTTDEPTDSRNGDQDLWKIVGPGDPDFADGDLLFWGVIFGMPRTISGVTLSEVILEDPIFVAGDGSMIGGNNGMDMGSVTLTLPPLGPTLVSVTSFIDYEALETINVPLGTFDNVLRLGLAIDGQVPPFGSFSVRAGTFWYGRDVGLLKQDQSATDEEAQVQGADMATVGGVPVVPSGCAVIIVPDSESFPDIGGGGSIAVTTTPDDCEWEATTGDPWITITGGASGMGAGTVTYDVDANTTTESRMGTIMVGGRGYTVTQAAACIFTLSPEERNFGPQGGEESFFVMASSQSCDWIAGASDPWITITDGGSATGSGEVFYTVAENLGASRMGTIAVGGQVHTVTQDPACIITIDPPQTNFFTLEGSGEFSVTPNDPACAWEVSTDAPWITITDAGPGIGSGVVTYSVDENIGGLRIGTIMAGSGEHRVVQAANREFDSVVSHVMGEPNALTAEELFYADVNYDGVIDVADILAINLQTPDAVRWIGTEDGSWHDVNNWSGGFVPAANDFVIIDSDGDPVTVTISQNITISQLRIRNRFRLEQHDNLTISGANVTINGIALVDGMFTVENNSAITVTGAHGPVQFNDSTLRIRGGAHVSMPQLETVSYSRVANPTLFDVAGQSGEMVHSRLDLPGLTSITFDTGNASNLTATILAGGSNPPGGQIDVSALQTFTPGTNDRLGFRVDNGGSIQAGTFQTPNNLSLDVNAGGTLELPMVAGELISSGVDVALNGSLSLPNVTGFRNALGTVTIRGSLDAPMLATISNTNLAVRDSANLILGALMTLERGSGSGNPTVTVSGTATLSLPELPTIVNVNFTISGSGSVSVPKLTDYTATNQSVLLSLDGAATFEAPLLANIPNLKLRVRNGAQLGLLSVTSYNWTDIVANPLIFEASGEDSNDRESVLDLSNLTTLTFDTGNASNLTATVQAGASNLPRGLVDLSGLSTLTVGTNDRLGLQTNNGGMIDVGALESTSGLSIDINAGGTLTLPMVTGAVTGSAFNVAAGGTLSLPNVTAISNTRGTLVIGGTLDAPMLVKLSNTSLTFNSTADVTLPALTTLERGSGSANPTVTVRDSASLSLPELTDIVDINFTLTHSGSVAAPKLMSYTATNASVLLSLDADATFNAELLSDITSLKLRARNGAQLSLLSVSSYAWDNIFASPLIFEASGEDSNSQESLLNLSSMTTLRFDSGSGSNLVATIQAGATGRPRGLVDLSALQTYTQGGTSDRLGFQLNNGGMIDVSILGTTSGFSIDVNAGGSLELPMVTGVLTNSAINVAAGGSLSLPNVSEISNSLSVLTFADTFNAPVLATLSDTSLTVRGTADLTLGALTTLERGGGTGNPTVTVRDDASLTLSEIPAMENINFTLTHNGAVSAPLLAAYTGTNASVLLSLDAGATFLAGLLSNITNLKLRVRNGAGLSLPGVTSYAWDNIFASPTIFEASGEDASDMESVLDLSNVASLTFDSGSASNLTATIQAGAAGRPRGLINLSALQTYTQGAANDRLGLRVDSSGMIDLSALETTSGVSFDINAGGSLTAPMLLGTLSNGGIDVATGGSLSLPNITAIMSMFGTVTLRGTLNVPLLTTLSNTSVTVRDSGTFDPIALTRIERGTGTGNPTVTVSQTAVFTAPELTDIENANFTLTQDGQVTANKLANYTSNPATNSSVLLSVSNDAVFTAPALVDITNLRLRTRTGGQLSLLGVQSYSFIDIFASPTIFDAQGQTPTAIPVFSMIDLSNVTTLTFNTGSASALTATILTRTGGDIDVSSLANFSLGPNHKLRLTANGAGSLIDLSSVIVGVNLPPAEEVDINPENGGEVRLGPAP